MVWLCLLGEIANERGPGRLEQSAWGGSLPPHPLWRNSFSQSDSSWSKLLTVSQVICILKGFMRISFTKIALTAHIHPIQQEARIKWRDPFEDWSENLHSWLGGGEFPLEKHWSTQKSRIVKKNAFLQSPKSTQVLLFCELQVQSWYKEHFSDWNLSYVLLSPQGLGTILCFLSWE